MGKGGGGSGGGQPAPQQNTTYTNNLPEYARPFYEKLMGRAEDISTEAYIPYTEQRIAERDPSTLLSREMAVDLGSSGAPTQFTQAQNLVTSAGGFRPGTFQTQEFTGADARKYMNPYLENVLDTQFQRSQQQFAEQQAGRDAAAVKSGAFGGTRGAVADEMARSELNSRLQESIAKEYQNAYANAQSQFERDQARAAAGQAQEEASRQYGAKIGLTAAEQLRALGTSEFDVTGRQLGLLQQAGAQTEEDAQRQLDLAYRDFLTQRDYEKEQLNVYNAALRGMPIAPSYEQITYTQPPSVTSQMMGLGLGGLSLSKAMG